MSHPIPQICQLMELKYKLHIMENLTEFWKKPPRILWDKSNPYLYLHHLWNIAWNREPTNLMPNIQSVFPPRDLSLFASAVRKFFLGKQPFKMLLFSQSHPPSPVIPNFLSFRITPYGAIIPPKSPKMKSSPSVNSVKSFSAVLSSPSTSWFTTVPPATVLPKIITSPIVITSKM